MATRSSSPPPGTRLSFTPRTAYSTRPAATRSMNGLDNYSTRGPPPPLNLDPSFLFGSNSRPSTPLYDPYAPQYPPTTPTNLLPFSVPQQPPSPVLPPTFNYGSSQFYDTGSSGYTNTTGYPSSSSTSYSSSLYGYGVPPSTNNFESSSLSSALGNVRSQPVLPSSSRFGHARSSSGSGVGLRHNDRRHSRVEAPSRTRVRSGAALAIPPSPRPIAPPSSRRSSSFRESSAASPSSVAFLQRPQSIGDLPATLGSSSFGSSPSTSFLNASSIAPSQIFNNLNAPRTSITRTFSQVDADSPAPSPSQTPINNFPSYSTDYNYPTPLPNTDRRSSVSSVAPPAAQRRRSNAGLPIIGSSAYKAPSSFLPPTYPTPSPSRDSFASSLGSSGGNRPTGVNCYTQVKDREPVTRTSFSQHDLAILKQEWNQQNYFPSYALRTKIGNETQLTDKQVQTWFANRRSRATGAEKDRVDVLRNTVASTSYRR